VIKNVGFTPAVKLARPKATTFVYRVKYGSQVKIQWHPDQEFLKANALTFCINRCSIRPELLLLLLQD
jgi:hypothetical protein